MAMMPPTALIDRTPPAGNEKEGSGHTKEWFDDLRNLRSEFQDLQTFLANVKKGEITLAAFARYVEKTNKDIAALLNKIHDGDVVRHIANMWEQMIFNPILAAPTEKLDAQSQLHYLNLLDEQISDVVFSIGYLTIPDRLNGWLKQSRPGYYIPFHVVFEDEVPEAKERMRI